MRRGVGRPCLPLGPGLSNLTLKFFQGAGPSVHPNLGNDLQGNVGNIAVGWARQNHLALCRSKKPTFNDLSPVKSQPDMVIESNCVRRGNGKPKPNAHTYPPPLMSRARFSKRRNSPWKASFTIPVCPLRCLPMMSSATPGSAEVSGL